MISRILAATVLMVASAVAGAATPDLASGPTLSVSKGTVLVNDGSRFVTAKPGQKLKAGDRVMVMTGGTATLNYSDGSKSVVPSGSMYSIASTTPAAQSPAAPRKVGAMYAQAVGDTNDSRKCKDDNGRPIECAAVVAPEDNSALVGVGAGVVVLGLAAAIAGFGGSNHHDGETSISQP